MDTPHPDRGAAPAALERPIEGENGEPIVPLRSTYPRGHHIRPHWHARAQFVYAVAGTMSVRTPRRAWIVPPTRALWVPARTVHEIRTYETVEMRSLYVRLDHSQDMPVDCAVLAVTPLLRELVVRAAEARPAGDGGADDQHELLMRLMMAEIRTLDRCALDLPLPESADLGALCEAILADLATRRASALDARAMGTSARTLYRRFLRETGITFARWKQQARLLEAIRRLSGGASVTAVALDLGYDSPSAFSNMFRRALGVAPRAYGRSSGASRYNPGFESLVDQE